jgi:hypothetical protein
VQIGNEGVQSLIQGRNVLGTGTQVFEARVGTVTVPAARGREDGTVRWASKKWLRISEQEECVADVKGVDWLELTVSVSDVVQPVWLDPFVAR